MPIYTHNTYPQPGRPGRQWRDEVTPRRPMPPRDPRYPGWPYRTVGAAVYIWPTYLAVDGWGLYRLPATGDAWGVTCTVTGWVILRVPRATPQSWTVVNEATPPNQTTSTHINLPVCRVSFAAGVVTFVERPHIGPFHVYGILT
jgi:hypothetical protein